MIRIWMGNVVVVEEDSFNRRNILEEYQAFQRNRQVKFMIRHRDRTITILDYRDILLKRTIKNNIVVKNNMLFDQAFYYFHNMEALYSGSALGVVDATGKLEFILEYFDNNNFIEKSGQHYYKWFYDPNSKYSYDRAKLMELFYGKTAIIFESAEEYTIHLARLLLLEKQKLPDIKLYFLDERALYFFDRQEVRVISNCSQIIEGNAAMRIVSKKDTTAHSSVEIMMALYEKEVTRQLKPPTAQPFLIYNDSFHLSGMVDVMRFTIPNALIARKKGYIPVINITDNLMYGDAPGENIWEYYFNTVGGYSVDQAYASGNYMVSSRDSFQMVNEQQRERVEYNIHEEIGRLVWKPEIAKYCESEVPHEFREGKRILGVISRGTDFNRSAVIARDGTPLPGNGNARVEQLIEITKRKMEENEYDYIYLATEDQYNYSEYVKAFGDRVLATRQERMDLIKNKQYISEPYMSRIPKLKSGFEYGLDYLVVLTCLAKCDALMASYSCGAFVAAVGLNKNQYKDVFVV